MKQGTLWPYMEDMKEHLDEQKKKQVNKHPLMPMPLAEKVNHVRAEYKRVHIIRVALKFAPAVASAAPAKTNNPGSRTGSMNDEMVNVQEQQSEKMINRK